MRRSGANRLWCDERWDRSWCDEKWEVYGEYLAHSCIEGYILKGESRRRCRSDRKWSGSAPSCVPGCGVPERLLDNAYSDALKDSYLVDEQVEYVCKFGFDMTGEPHVTCLEGGTWSRPRFACVRRRCTNPEQLRNGYREGNDFSFGRVIRFHCNVGYEMLEQQNFITCTARGAWQGQLPTCRIIECPAPIAPEHGNVDMSGVDFVYGEQVRYSCNFGYKLEGNSVGRCNENSTWGQLPMCVFDRNCTFEDARLSTCTYSVEGVGWERTFTNHDGMGKAGYVMRFSLRNNGETHLVSGIFPRETVFCLKFRYLLRRLLQGNDFQLKIINSEKSRKMLWKAYRDDVRNTWLDTDLLLPIMMEQYRIEFVVRKTSSVSTSVDLDDITLSSAEDCDDSCASIPCQHDGTCLNRISGYKCFCQPGYYGDRCENVVSCIVPSNIPFGSILTNQTSVRFDMSVTYQCQEFYHIQGTKSFQASVTCKLQSAASKADPRFGVWSSPTPRCVEIQCPLPTLPFQIILSAPTSRKTFRRGEKITYRCNSGYNMANYAKKRLTVTCRRNGTWSNSLPICYDGRYKCTSDGLLCHFPFKYGGHTFSTCTNHRNSNLWCANDANSNRRGYCAPCPSRWGGWSEWSECSMTCGDGVQTSQRSCLEGEPGSPYCEGNYIRSKSCEQAVCVNKETKIGNSVFGFFHSSRNYEQAQAHCRQYGGSLAKIPNHETNNAIYAVIRELPAIDQLKWSAHRTIYYIGLNDAEQEGTWVWQDGMTPRWTNWHWRSPTNTEPNGRRQENCVVISREEGAWFDFSCNEASARPIYFICEKKTKPCDISPCQHGGTCHNDGVHYLCVCPAAISGRDCDEIEDMCWSSPCLNGATCEGNPTSYTCKCAGGFSGRNCETVVCEFPTNVPDRILLQGNEGTSYAVGEKLPVRCSNPTHVINLKNSYLLCGSGGIWRPPLGIIRCS